MIPRELQLPSYRQARSRIPSTMHAWTHAVPATQLTRLDIHVVLTILRNHRMFEETILTCELKGRHDLSASTLMVGPLLFVPFRL